MTVVEGPVEHGDARGGTIGFPTTALALPGAGPARSPHEHPARPARI
ncbi:riboflavin kinase [Kocuria sp. M1R5S2]